MKISNNQNKFNYNSNNRKKICSITNFNNSKQILNGSSDRKVNIIEEKIIIDDNYVNKTFQNFNILNKIDVNNEEKNSQVDSNEKKIKTKSNDISIRKKFGKELHSNIIIENKFSNGVITTLKNKKSLNKFNKNINLYNDNYNKNKDYLITKSNNENI
jgi:hypothetical protein